jgi:hypothetical protein
MQGFKNDTISVYRNGNQLSDNGIISTDESLQFADRFLVVRSGTRFLTIRDNQVVKNIVFADSIPCFLLIHKELKDLKVRLSYLLIQPHYK